MNEYDDLKKLNTTEVSDALDSLKIKGALHGLKSLQEGTKLIGSAFTVEYVAYEEKPDDFKPAADYIDEVPEGAVIVIDNKGRKDCSTWGNILTETALYKKIAGTVVFGAIRDANPIKKLNYPLFHKAITMCSGKNRVYKKSQQTPLVIEGVIIRPGDLIFADENGVLVIPEEFVHEVMQRAKNIKITEEKIIKAVLEGMTLAEARVLYHYNKPWDIG